MNSPKIILIGPPGAGKSTVGKALAKKMNCTFADTDRLIEAEVGKKISEIFVESGEEIFRDHEARTVKNSLSNFDGVLALGGGAPINPESQKLLDETKSTIVFLDVSLSQAANRVGFNRERPLLLVNPRQQWQELMNTRRPIYEKLADVKISTDSVKPQEVAEQIVKWLSSKGE